MSEISQEASSRICKHMNEDHGVSVYAMVLSTLEQESSMSISNCTLKDVSLTKMAFSYVTCDKSTCSSKETVMKFDPPLESSSEIRPRLVKLHHDLLSPKFSWLVTKPICTQVVFIVAALGYFTYTGLEAFLLTVNTAPEFLKSIITAVFGSDENLFSWICYLFKGINVAHMLEAFYVVYLCKQKLKLKTPATLSWYILVALAGYPMTSKVLDFVKVCNDSKMKKK